MLQLSLLGDIVIRLDGKPIPRISSKKEIALLAYLAHNGGAQSREFLADMLWEARTTRQSLSNLRTLLTRMRSEVAEHLDLTPQTVGVKLAVHEGTDTARFRSLIASAGQERSVKAVNRLAQGLDLHAGEFMAGFFLPKAPRFNDWLLVEQEHLRRLALQGYRQLAGWQEEQGDFAAGIVTAQRWVTWDPLDETAQRQLMRLLAFDGRTSEALAVFEKCRNLLETEFAIPPSSTTTALHTAIQEGSLEPPEIAAPVLHNLPRALLPMFGRKREIAELRSTLLNRNHPLIAILGPGGIGKTSLALAVGRALVAESHPFEDGVWFVSLEGIENESPEHIKGKVAALVSSELGLYFHGESDLWSQLLGQLASKNLLLILDNVEQFLTVASDLIAELLEACDSLNLLVTSRITLPLASSVAFPLTGLEIPTEGSAQAVQNESVALFAERAARTPSPFHLEKHLEEVVAICQFVEGLPLGIELAAASLGRLMPDEIMPALTSNLRLLDTNRRDMPPRQRTLHAVFDSSWQMLTAGEQTVLAQIATFHDGFTRQAAEAVFQDSTEKLISLLDHALLNRDELGRFRMHPILRQLASEKLNSPNMSEVKEQALKRHSRFFADLVRSFEHDLQLGVGPAEVQAILPEQANLRAAWHHAVQTKQWQIIADCLDGAHYFYRRKGLFSEEASLVDDAIMALHATMAEDDAPLTALLARLLVVKAWGYLHSADFEKGIETAERVCALTDKLENSVSTKLNANTEAYARVALGRIFMKKVECESALANYERVVTLAKIAQNPLLEADGWSGIGSQRIICEHDAELAREPLHRGLQLCQNHNYRVGEMATLILLGDLEHGLENYALSRDYFEQALKISRLVGDVITEAEASGNTGVAAAAQGDLSTALSFQKEALTTYRLLNMHHGELWMLSQLGYSARCLGDYSTAEEYLTKALAIATQIKDLYWQPKIKMQLGITWNEFGDTEKALVFLEDAYRAAGLSPHPRLPVIVLHSWAMALLRHADWAQAEQKLQETYDFWQEAGLPYEAPALSSLSGLAYATYQQNNLSAAADYADKLWNIWQENPLLAGQANLQLYWLLGTVWDGLGDSRVQQLWERAGALLQQRSEQIEDEGARKMFLENVPAHRAIMTATGEG